MASQSLETLERKTDEVIVLEQGAPFDRRIGMQREVHEFGLDVEVLLQFFSTHGTEIAPRSNIVREYFEYDGLFAHIVSF